MMYKAAAASDRERAQGGVKREKVGDFLTVLF